MLTIHWSIDYLTDLVPSAPMSKSTSSTKPFSNTIRIWLSGRCSTPTSFIATWIRFLSTPFNSADWSFARTRRQVWRLGGTSSGLYFVTSSFPLLPLLPRPNKHSASDEKEYDTYRRCSISPSAGRKNSLGPIFLAAPLCSSSVYVFGCNEIPPPVSLICGFFSYNSQSTKGSFASSRAVPRPPGPPPIMATLSRISFLRVVIWKISNNE